MQTTDERDDMHAIDMRLTTHEAVCAERYRTLGDSLDAVRKTTSQTQGIMLAVAGAVLMELLGLVIVFMTR